MKIPPSSGHQRGATLMIALMLLALILLLGAATTSLLLLEERAARNHREHAQARLAAQAALEDACDDIRERRSIDPDQFSTALGCRSDAAGAGLCLGKHERSGWEPGQLHGPQAISATYGQFTGRRFRAAPCMAAPRYLIERLPPAPAKESGKASPEEPSAALHRISAVGYGRHGAVAALQALVQWPASRAGAMASCPLLAWRPLYLPNPE